MLTAGLGIWAVSALSHANPHSAHTAAWLAASPDNRGYLLRRAHDRGAARLGPAGRRRLQPSRPGRTHGRWAAPGGDAAAWSPGAGPAPAGPATARRASAGRPTPA